MDRFLIHLFLNSLATLVFRKVPANGCVALSLIRPVPRTKVSKMTCERSVEESHLSSVKFWSKSKVNFSTRG